HRLAHQAGNVATLMRQGAQLAADIAAKWPPRATALLAPIAPVTSSTTGPLWALWPLATPVMSMRAAKRAEPGAAEWAKAGTKARATRPLVKVFERLAPAIGNRVDLLALDNFHADPAAIFQ